jgi:hypothetical protein
MTQSKLTTQLRQELDSIVEKMEGKVVYSNCLNSSRQHSKKIIIDYDYGIENDTV